MELIDISKKFNKEMLENFSNQIKEINKLIDFKVSSRGWAYLLETYRVINKDQFNKAQNLINKCRKEGYLPIDFVAEDSNRAFEGIFKPTSQDPISHMRSWFEACTETEDYYHPDYQEDEDYYIQVLVEKVDLKTLFRPVTDRFHIAIANSAGWSSMLQRAEYARRFQIAEQQGKKCVLLYCGDHDPDGLRISDTIIKNLFDLRDVEWNDGTEGYNPENLIVDRFGLNRDFIEANKLTWINNLITGSEKEIAKVVNGRIVPGRHERKGVMVDHPNFNMPYMQKYLTEIGVRKCEANAIVTAPKQARRLIQEAIEKWIGTDYPDRVRAKKQPIIDQIQSFRDDNGITDMLGKIIDIIDGHDE